ncbi:MAG: ATP-binding protein [candidate division Zixibacteria bacterium]|nr:ATP-binding protein [candidate division Zixibacteria bacterium]
MEWQVDFKELISFLGRTIYRPENVLVELCANSYDADSSMVEISTKGESEQILIKDDGCGMCKEELHELVTLAKSKKKALIENGETTPKFHRRFLGSFGIGIVSFFALGDFIRIYTLREGKTPLFLEIKKTFDDKGKLTDIKLSDPIESEEYKQHLLAPEHGTTIEINNNKLDFAQHYRLIRHKLSNLPLCDNFVMKLNELEIKKDDFDKSSWIEKKFDFILDNIDPSYKSECSIYVNFQTTIDQFTRGVYLVVNGRVIEKDLYSELYSELTSPATISARVRGFIKADYLEKSIQANREDFFDSAIINEIKTKIKAPLSEIIDDYNMQRSTEEKEQIYTDLLQRVEKAKNKFHAPNEHLRKLGINFASNPEFEQVVVLIIAQLCQKGLLPFQIIDYNGGSHIDCIVKWPLSQSKRDPDFIAELEVETTLDRFFDHEHDFRTKPDICCWEIKPADFERRKRKYIENRPESIASIDLKAGIDVKHFGHQKELHFTVRDTHNQLTTSILRVYVLSEIIEKHAQVTK